MCGFQRPPDSLGCNSTFVLMTADESLEGIKKRNSYITCNYFYKDSWVLHTVLASEFGGKCQDRLAHFLCISSLYFMTYVRGSIPMPSYVLFN